MISSGLKGDKDMLRVWDEVNQFTDTNAMLLGYMRQCHLFIISLQRDMDNERRAIKERLDALTNKSDDAKAYKVVQEEWRLTQADMIKQIADLFKTQKQIAAEYRQCMMKREFLVHIAQVIQLKDAYTSALHRHIFDQSVLDGISDEMTEISTTIFGISSSSEYINV